MSSIVKAKLKAAKEAVGKKDYEKARDASLAVLDYDSENYHAYVAIFPTQSTTLVGTAVMFSSACRISTWENSNRASK